MVTAYDQASAGRGPGGAYMADVFLSYSRRDREVTLRLHAALVERGKEVWIDEEDIPPTAHWRDDVREAIEAADSFVFLISPDSAASPECACELEHAEALSKRVIGVLVRAIDPQDLPESLSDGRSAITSGAAAMIWSTELASPLATIEQLARQRVPAGFSAAEIASYLQGIGP